jgi:rhomboid protease GluP
VAGIYAGLLWLVLVMAPMLLQRLVFRLSMAQRFGQAARVATFMRYLHPADGWWQLPTLFEALAAAQRGERATAVALLTRLESGGPKGAPQPLVMAQLYRVTGRWDELTAWIESLGPRALEREVGLLPVYLRGLCETGRLEDAVACYERHRRPIDLVDLHNRQQLRLVLLSFGGRRDAVERLLAGSLAALPRAAHALWHATAAIAAGELADGERRLASLEDDGDYFVRWAIERRRTRPPAFERSADLETRLAAIEAEARHEDDYRPMALDTRSRPYATFAVVALNLAVFALEVMRGGSTDQEVLLDLGALASDLVLLGDWWRLATASVLHYGPLHLALNMFGLLFFGPFVERHLGARRFVVLYALTSIGAMAAPLLKAILIAEPAIVLGASGGVMGLIGGSVAILWRGWRSFPRGIAGARLRSMALLVVLQAILDMVTPELSGSAHLMGAALGILAGLALLPPAPPAPTPTNASAPRRATPRRSPARAFTLEKPPSSR